MPPAEIACPACGAPVRFVSAASLLVVCPSCRTTLMRRDLDVEKIGRMAQLLADASPVRLGAEGRYRGTHFAVAGRVQVQWSAGTWNEWHLVFDDGRHGWLAEAAGEYTMTFDVEAPASVPVWDALRPGLEVVVSGDRYEVTDVREARVVGAEGELPFRVEGGWSTRTADLRSPSGRFATLDYSETPTRAYVGEAVTLGGLDLRGLREPAPWR